MTQAYFVSMLMKFYLLCKNRLTKKNICKLFSLLHELLICDSLIDQSSCHILYIGKAFFRHELYVFFHACMLIWCKYFTTNITLKRFISQMHSCVLLDWISSRNKSHIMRAFEWLFPIMNCWNMVGQALKRNGILSIMNISIVGFCFLNVFQIFNTFHTFQNCRCVCCDNWNYISDKFCKLVMD